MGDHRAFGEFCTEGDVEDWNAVVTPVAFDLHLHLGEVGDLVGITVREQSTMGFLQQAIAQEARELRGGLSLQRAHCTVGTRHAKHHLPRVLQGLRRSIATAEGQIYREHSPVEFLGAVVSHGVKRNRFPAAFDGVIPVSHAIADVHAAWPQVELQGFEVRWDVGIGDLIQPIEVLWRFV